MDMEIVSENYPLSLTRSLIFYTQKAGEFYVISC